MHCIAGIYTDEYARMYSNVNMYELPPHVYAVADLAYRQMRDELIDQVSLAERRAALLISCVALVLLMSVMVHTLRSCWHSSLLNRIICIIHHDSYSSFVILIPLMHSVCPHLW